MNVMLLKLSQEDSQGTPGHRLESLDVELLEVGRESLIVVVVTVLACEIRTLYSVLREVRALRY